MAYNTQTKIDEVCLYRALPAIKKGMRCEIDGRKGEIVGGNSSANFNVKFDDNGIIRNCHPGWKMTIYSNDGSVIHQSQD